MSLINFGYRVDMYTIDPPTDPSAYLVAYDLDGVLKQKDYLGNVTILGGGSIGPQGVSGPVGPGGLTWSGYWLATQSYNVNYAVGYASASWWCIADIVGSTSNSGPNIDTTHWALLASQGSPGPMGPGGTAGLQGAQGATGGVGLTPSLQQVGNIGASFSKTTPGYILNFDMDQDGYTRIQRQEGTEITRYYQEGIQIDISHSCPETDIESQILFNRAYLSLHQGVISTGKSTTIDFLDPTNLTYLKIPAKSADGVYTIATLDDVTSPNLQQVTDVGNTTDNSIEVTGSGDERVFMSNSAYISITNQFSTESLSLEPNMISFEKNGFNSTLRLVGTVSGGRTYQLPDESGIIALLSNIGVTPSLQQVLAVGDYAESLNTKSSIYLDLGNSSPTVDFLIKDESDISSTLTLNPTEGRFYQVNVDGSDSMEVNVSNSGVILTNRTSNITNTLVVTSSNEATIFNTPSDKTAGTYTLATTADITGTTPSTLQQVLNTGNTATSPNTKSVTQIDLSDSFPYLEFTLKGTDDLYSNIIASKNSISISNGDDSTGVYKSVGMYSSVLEFRNVGTNSSTFLTVPLSTPGNYVDFYFPSNKTTGSYTLATLDDIGGGGTDLQGTLDLGHYAQSPSGYSSINFNLDNSNPLYRFIAREDSGLFLPLTTFEIQKASMVLSNAGATHERFINLSDGGLILGNIKSSDAFGNKIQINESDNNCTYILPDKATGTYTFATLDDIGGGGTPSTLQQVLDNNHDLIDGNNFQGTEAGLNAVGSNIIALGTQAAKDTSAGNVIALGEEAAKTNGAQHVIAIGNSTGMNNTGPDGIFLGNAAGLNNTGYNVNIFGSSAGSTNTGNNVNLFGAGAGSSNTFNNVHIFGQFAEADDESQLVFKRTGNARISFKNITADRKWELPDASGTIALISDIGAPIISATYGALQTLVATNALSVGATYILLEYKTIYQINGSNTTGIVQLHTVIGAAASVYSQFVNVPSEIGSPGNFAGVTVTVEAVVPGATLTVGQTLTITTWFSSSYIIFSPTVVGVNIGCTLKFEKQRYPNVTPGITYSDIYGKPIMKPGGVLNTEVHDGTPYMSMTASENPAVLTESIILKAIDTNKFSRDAESLTFPGDKLVYDYTDNIVYDENGDFRANKPGTIIQRTNISGTITMNKDWRVQRYRRYGVDSTNWTKLTLATASVYKIGANSECTVTNASITADHKYIASDPYIDNFFNDFSKNTANIFLTGTNSAPSLAAGERANYQLSGYEYMNILNIESFTSSVKDFNIIPIVNGEPTALTTKCIVNNVNNTVFLPYTQTYGTTFNLNVESKNGDITNSTFASLPRLVNTGKINKLTVLDYITLNNFSTYNDREDNAGSILNSLMLSYASFANTGEIVNTTIGGGAGFTTAFNNIQFVNSSIYNCVIGGHRNSNMTIENLKANKSLICLYGSTLMSITGKIYLTALKNSSTSSHTSNIKLNTFAALNPNKSLYGYLYDFSVGLSDMEINNMTLDKRLVYQYLDNSNVLISATVSVVQ